MNSIERSVLRSADGPWSLGAGAGGKPGAPQQASQPPQGQGMQVQLTRHEKRTFVAQTVHLGGSAFVDCTFESCTLIMTNTPFIFSGQCKLSRCNWRIEFDLLWGAPGMRAQLRQILDTMDSAVEGAPKPS